MTCYPQLQMDSQTMHACMYAHMLVAEVAWMEVTHQATTRLQSSMHAERIDWRSVLVHAVEV